MNEAVPVALAVGSGIALGAVFFGGLWWTVQRAMASPRPALWFFVSLVARSIVVLVGFGLVGTGHAVRLVLCLVGFAVAGLLVARWTRSPVEARRRPAQGAHHAPNPR